MLFFSFFPEWLSVSPGAFLYGVIVRALTGVVVGGRSYKTVHFFPGAAGRHLDWILRDYPRHLAGEPPVAP